MRDLPSTLASQNECLGRLFRLNASISEDPDALDHGTISKRLQTLYLDHKTWLETFKNELESIECMVKKRAGEIILKAGTFESNESTQYSHAENDHHDSNQISADVTNPPELTSVSTTDGPHGSINGPRKNDKALKDMLQYPRAWPLEKQEYRRYGRQLIMPEVGLQGQLKLKKSRVLLIGAGGLGCPAAAYLAGAGVGTLGIVDGDTVEASNLHRQIMHDSNFIGMNKAESVSIAIKRINPLTIVECFTEPLTPLNAETITKNFDIILDCTDTPASRYLISDIAVLLRKTLVSASALKTEGQLMVLNNPPLPPGSEGGGPCYRCIFPKPPPPESVLTCGEGGILGPVVGTMGVLQALEAIKVITRDAHVSDGEPRRPTLLMFSAMSESQFRAVKLRGRRKGCVACSEETSLSLSSLRDGSQDYVAFCGSASQAKVDPEDQISVEDLLSTPRNILDVRDRVQYEICSLPNSVNVPFSEVLRWKDLSEAKSRIGLNAEENSFRVICRMGNDSQVTVKKLKELGFGNDIKDVKGGFDAWKKSVDSNWPDY